MRDRIYRIGRQHQYVIGCADKREIERRIAAVLWIRQLKVNRSRIHTRGCVGLQAAQRKAQFAQRAR